MNTKTSSAQFAYLQHGEGKGPFSTEKVLLKLDTLWWQERGLSYTASGYGSKIPSEYKVKYINRWYRVYVCIYGNSGTSYIISKGQQINVSF